MHVAHVGAFADPLRRDPEELLEAWPALLSQAQAVVDAGVRVTIVQAAAQDATLQRNSVAVRFVRVRGTHRGAARIARAVRDLAPDIIHLQGLRFPLHVHALRRACPATPLLAQDHADVVPGRLRALLEKPLLSGLDAVCFTTAEQAQPMLRSGVLPADIAVCEAPAASTRFTPGDRKRAAHALGLAGAPCIAWVGRLAAVKDPITALEAFRTALPDLPHARLYCAFADAPLLDDVQQYLAGHPELQERVTLLGALAAAEVELLLRGADVFLAASHSESTGFALLEALACGATPAVTDIPAFRALTGNGTIGRLYPVGAVQAGAAALIEAARVAHDRDAVRRHFERNLSQPALGRRLQQAYAAQLTRRSVPPTQPARVGPGGQAARGVRRLRVCLLVPGGVDRSGTHRVIPCVLALIERLGRSVELHVVATRQSSRAEAYDLLGARVHCLPAASRSAAVRWLVRQHRRTPFDVLHALWMHPQGTAAALAGAILRRPVLLHINGGDMAALRDIGFGGRCSLTGRVRLRLALAGATRVTVPSARMATAARSLRADAERLTLGVPEDRWPVLAPRPRAPGEPLRLLSIGSLNAVKDHATLLRAYALLRTRGVAATLTCVGEDTLGGAVQRLAADLGVADAVEFTGFLPHAALHARCGAAHALVVSSRFEADPIAALEAATAGLAVVGTAVGHLAEWAPDAALTCAAGDAQGLAGIMEAIATDDALRLRLAAAAQCRARGHDADRAAARVLEIYHELSGRCSSLRT